jgi:hypothetical protein
MTNLQRSHVAAAVGDSPIGPCYTRDSLKPVWR